MVSARGLVRIRVGWNAGSLALLWLLFRACALPAQDPPALLRALELKERGDFAGAEASARQAFVLQRQRYGPGHRETLKTAIILGQIQQEKGDLEAALETTREALRTAGSALGDVRETAVLAASLGVILDAKGDLDGALEYQRRALRIYEAIGRSYSPGAIQVLSNIGTTLYKQGDLKEARRALEEALLREEKLAMPDDLRAAAHKTSLSIIHLRLGDLDEALETARPAFQTYERTHGGSHPDTVAAANNLGLVLETRGDLDGALRYLEQALRADEAAYGPDHAYVALRSNHIARVLWQKGDLAAARAAAARALAIDRRTYGALHANVARDSETLARILLALGDLEGARLAARRALNIDEVQFGPDHKDVARDSATLAAVHLAQGERDVALRLARRALAIGEQTFGPDNPEVALYARSVGQVLREQGDFRGARDHFARAHQTLARTYGLDNPTTREAARDLQAEEERIARKSRRQLLFLVVALVLVTGGAAGLLLHRRRRLARRAATLLAPALPGLAMDSLTLTRIELIPDRTPAEGSAPMAVFHSPQGELTRIGPYRLEKRLGAGGMGVVYKAYDERLDRWVAVKLISPGKGQDSHRRERLRREARASARLSHSAIIPVYDLVHGEEVDGIVMELVEGEPLANLLQSGPLDLPRALPIARDVTDALTEAHSKGIVHRDLKAENVLVTPAGRAKVFDFGIAKRLDGSDASLTVEGALIGTYRAMAPEQAEGKDVDHRADLFALGTLFYELFTGHSPFLGPNVAATLRRICFHRQLPARDLNPEIPPEISELIDRLLEKSPQLRPDNAYEVAVVLARAAAQLPE